MSKQQILYEDKDILVCHKPAGIATQSARIGQRDMVSEVANYIAAAAAQDGKNNKPSYVGLIHRLDQPVEGILVFAKNKKAAAELSRQITANQMEKHYYAIVSINKDADGISMPNEADEPSEANEPSKPNEPNKSDEPNSSDEITLINYLYKDARTNTAAVVNKEHSGAKRAELRYKVLSRISVEKFLEEYKDRLLNPDKESAIPYLTDFENMDMAMVHIKLITGRYHQIRAQMSHAGMSLVGDYKYADDRTRKLSDFISQKQVALCAYELAFNNPVTGKRMSFQIEPTGQIFQNFSL